MQVPIVIISVGDRFYKWSTSQDEYFQKIAIASRIDGFKTPIDGPSGGIENVNYAKIAPTSPSLLADHPAVFTDRLLFGPNDVGTIIVIDHSTRKTSDKFNKHLVDVAQAAEQILSLYLQNEKLSAERDFFRLLAETSSETIVRGDLEGVRLYVSPSIRNLLGYDPEELVGRKAIDITHPDDVIPLREMIKNVFNGHIETGLCELRQRHKNGSWVWMEASQRLTYNRASGEPDGYVVSVRGIDRRKAYEAELERLADQDELTGLPNRTLFRKRLNEWLFSKKSFSLFYMDLDDFKLVNDQLGHQVGDFVLQELATRFNLELQSSDLIARIGGDEFNALVDISPECVEALCTRLIASAVKPVFVSDLEVRVGLSIGVVNISNSDQNSEMLLMRSDRALYKAKRAGKNTFCID